MVRTVLFTAAWLGLLLTLCPGRLPADPPPDNDPVIKATLALQRSLVSARQLLRDGEPKKAIDILEEQLGRVSGNAEFLRLLSEAYRAHIKEPLDCEQPCRRQALP